LDFLIFPVSRTWEEAEKIRGGLRFDILTRTARNQSVFNRQSPLFEPRFSGAWLAMRSRHLHVNL
jgi:hypothetical protein